MLTQPLEWIIKMKSLFYLGIDVGTSGIRAIVLDASAQICYQQQVSMPLPNKQHNTSEQDPSEWIKCLESLLSDLSKTAIAPRITHCMLDATSSTILLCNEKGQAQTTALMYDDKRASKEANLIKKHAPKQSAAHGASSALAKVMWLEKTYQNKVVSNQPHSTLYACHQVDFINHHLTGLIGISDENNVLKLGYDIIHRNWPAWINTLTKVRRPIVVAPGTELGAILPSIAKKFNLNPSLKIHAGTTDSIAAFLASGASKTGQAVTSLGSTLAIKLLTNQPVFEPELGIYSHYIEGKWLAGGASNAGGAIILDYFSIQEIETLLPTLSLSTPTGLNYYPLKQKGERFPTANPDQLPCLSPRPKNDAIFLQGIIEGLTEIEEKGLQKLATLSQTNLQTIFTAGGGTKNTFWMGLRKQTFQQQFKTKTLIAQNVDAAYGVALFLKRKLENDPSL